jgi:hypothetical protein
MKAQMIDAFDQYQVQGRIVRMIAVNVMDVEAFFEARLKPGGCSLWMRCKPHIMVTLHLAIERLFDGSFKHLRLGWRFTNGGIKRIYANSHLDL